MGGVQFATGGALGVVGTMTEELEELEDHSQEQVKIGLSNWMASFSSESKTLGHPVHTIVSWISLLRPS